MRRVYVRHPNYHHIVPSLVASGLEQLEEIVRLTVGIPLSPMLGSITRSLAEVFERLQGVDFTSEAKLDGQRGQIHVRVMRDKNEERQVREEVGSGGMWTALEDGQKVFVRLFSRHLEDMTEKVSRRFGHCYMSDRLTASYYLGPPVPRHHRARQGPALATDTGGRSRQCPLAGGPVHRRALPARARHVAHP